MKNQVCKRALSLGLAVLLTVGSVFAAPATEVSAAAAPSKITLSATKQTIGVGQTFKLKVKSVTPKTASKTVTFKSSNKKVATVTSKGSVKGIKAGTAKITVTSKAKKTVKATCNVTVAAISVKEAKKGVLALNVNKSLTVKPSMQPKSVAVAGYTYSVKNKKIATVTSKGKLTGVKAGTTTLTIKSKQKKKADPVFTLKLTVNVSEPSDSTQTPGSEEPGTQIPESEEPESEIPDVDDPNAIKTWKFDFGSADDVADGYTAVTADKDYYAANNTDGYGFLGINEKSAKISDRLDGFGNQLGQVQVLKTGGGTGLNDAVGCIGIVGQEEDPMGDEYYPTRFALKVEDDTYYRVTATVTTLDPSKDATATLYTERKHPIYTDKKIKAGQTSKAVFTIRVTPIYYQKSTPTGLIADGMVNVCVAGDNTALAALKIEQIETAPTLWVLGDSTVTDGNTSLPFFRLQNYTGVGTGITKYLPSDIAMVNEGEGGLNASDNLHYNVVKDRIKEGDWLYVEYGHNHKDDGTEGYKSALEKYYTLCNEKKAKLLIVSPIERINTFSGGSYQHTLENFARTGETFVQEKIAAGAENIAFVDLNKTSLEFYNKITADHGGSADAIKFYFCTLKGGTTDPTHPNDAGAENLAYCFFEAAKAVTDEKQKAVLAGLLDNMRSEKPNLVSEEIIGLGAAPNSAWPTYALPIDEVYPVAIKDIRFDADGKLASVKVNVQQAQNSMTAYGIIVVTIKDASGNVKGTLYAVDQVDNSTGFGPQTITNFRGVDANGTAADVKLADGDKYEAVVLQAVDGTPIVPADPKIEYSKTYTEADISDIDTYLLPGESGDVEDFDYFTKTELTGSDKWIFGGSSGKDLSFGKDADGRTYTNLISTGGGSWVIGRALENLTNGTGNTGNYMVEMDLKYVSGSNLKFSLVQETTMNKAPFIVDGTAVADVLAVGSGGALTSHGTALTAALTPNEWTHVKYVLHMDAGTAEITVGNNASQTVDVSEFATFGDVSVSTYKNFVITQTANRSVFSAQLSNLTVAKLKDTTAEVTVTAGLTDGAAGLGTVKINGTETGTAQVTQGSKVTFEAVPGSDSAFVGWYLDGSDKPYSTSTNLVMRAYKNMDLKAGFLVGTKTNVMVNFKDKDGNPIKDSETLTESGGVALYENQPFELADSYKQMMVLKDGELTKLYLYDSKAGTKTTIDSMGAAGSNIIDLVFELDGVYDEFEDFNGDTLTPANWGMTLSKGDTVSLLEGSLSFMNGNNGDTVVSTVKDLDGKISSAKKVTIRYDWRSDVEVGKGRNSSFNLKDSDGNIIFSLYANGSSGVTYQTNAAAGDGGTKIASTSSDWIQVKLTLDFEAKTIEGTLVNLTTGTEAAIAKTSLTTAANLAKLSADSGFSLAPQRLDNFGIRYTAE